MSVESTSKAAGWMGVGAFAIAALSGCAADVAPRGAFGADSQQVVGGAAETGYAPAGYLLRGPDERSLSPGCGVTLIAPDLAVTAAHCVVDDPRDGRNVSVTRTFAMGFGTPGPSSRRVLARGVLAQPAYYPDLASRTRASDPLADVAVLRLASPVTDIAPATISVPSAGCNARYVGYGRTTTGNERVYSGYTNERKSAAQCIDVIGATNIETHGYGGGLCWGDSGGPLFREGTTEILGVLADFGNNTYDCQVGNQMRFTSLASHRDFLDCASSRFMTRDGLARPAPFSDVLCHWAEGMLGALRDARAISGYPNGTFRPYGTITRAEFAAMIASALQPTAVRAATSFRDVSPRAWYARHVETAQRGGYLSGYPDGTFRPDAPVTRQDIFVALSSGLRLARPSDAEIEITLGQFADNSLVAAWARPQLAAAVRASVVTAYPSIRQLRPNLEARRADAAASVHQALVHLGRLAPVASEYIVPATRGAESGI
ncbi:MAG: S-layer homology domain-containing protein [Deltaproteobacteria bacterium]|jgi:V8-like Glu-specific endopeptidase